MIVLCVFECALNYWNNGKALRSQFAFHRCAWNVRKLVWNFSLILINAMLLGKLLNQLPSNSASSDEFSKTNPFSSWRTNSLRLQNTQN